MENTKRSFWTNTLEKFYLCKETYAPRIVDLLQSNDCTLTGIPDINNKVTALLFGGWIIWRLWISLTKKAQ